MKGEKKRRGLLLVQLFFVIAIICAFMIFFKPNLVGFTIFQSQPLEAGSNDTYIRQNLDTNYGEDSVLKIGKTSSGEDLRSLLQFDTSSIPSDNTIISAILEVYASTIPIKNVTLRAYRITTSWNELETGWNNAKSLQPWSTLGGDYAELSGQIEILNDSSRWYNLTLTNLVRGWVNTTYSNYGLILIASDATSGNYTYLDSSAGTNAPILAIDYTANAAPTINSISTDSSLSNPKQIGQQVTFTINWGDLEGNNAKAYICNSTNITTGAGCGDKTYCSTSFAQTNPITCSYTITSSENRTTSFSYAVCDLTNCSTISQSSFYVNHIPNITITSPDGGESITQSSGNFKVKFNVTDNDKDKLSANLYYGESPNSITHLITSNLNLTNSCLDVDSDTSTMNNCTYSWNTTGIYGNYYLTMIINDSFSLANDSSDAIFSIDSLTDDIAPNILAQWFDSDIFSGKSTQFYANVSDEYIRAVWVAINSSSGQTNLTMTNTTALTYNITWVASNIGSYQYKVYANDTRGNVNSTISWSSFTIRKPQAIVQNSQYPTTSLPYSTIRISSELNSTDSLKDISAKLIVPDGFSFLSGYNQNSYIGNFSANQIRNVSWYVSVPITESTYSLSINYSDPYSNIWNSSTFNIQVTSAVGSGYSLQVSGYPEVETSENYFTQAFFKQSGTYAAADSVNIKIYDASGILVVGPASMSNPSTGVYNYTYAIGASVTEGQWQTLVNATKSSTSYYDSEYFKVVGGPFDVRSIVVEDAVTTDLRINVTAENTGGANKDLTLVWNLTREDTQASLDSGSETFMVQANSERNWTITPSTTYVGEVRITFLGYYSGTEKAGAYKIFTTSSSGVIPVTPPSGGGGGGGGGSSTIVKTNFELTAESEITLTKNIEKNSIAIIKNIGSTKLTNVTLELEGLDSSYYTITPEKLSIEPGKEAKFNIKFLITDFIGEKDFYYLVKSSQETLRQQAKIIVLSMKEYFLNEVAKLQSRLDALKGNENVKDKIPDCELILNNSRTSIANEEFINAESSIKQADSCITNLEDKSKNVKEIPIINIKLSEYWAWIVTWVLIIILIVVLIIVIYIVYKKYQVIDILKQNQALTTQSNKDNFKDKIKKIEDELGK